MTDLKLLAATCNFGTLHDSLIREELVKVVDLDLDKCLRACSVSELSKERKKAIEATESINAVQKPNKTKQTGSTSHLKYVDD